MASTGGYYRRRNEPEDLFKKIKEDQDKTQELAYDTEVSEFLNDLLSSFDQRNRDVELINQHLDTIKSALESDIDGTLDLRYGGSLARKTFIEGFSDIDTILFVNKSELRKLSPEEIKEYIYSRLKERLPNTEIEMGSTVITVNYSDYQIQLLPALRDGSSYKVADPSDKNWMTIQPKKFAEKLTQINQQCLNKIIPTIKISKILINQQPENRRITGYHIESLAIDIFKSYSGPNITSAMLKHFFKEASLKVLSPIKDGTGHKINVDDKLGTENSLQRKIISDTLSRLHKKMDNADMYKDVKLWDNILNGD
jgi:hypothetical protein